MRGIRRGYIPGDGAISKRTAPSGDRGCLGYHCTTDLVQRLLVTRRELALEAAINHLDRFDLIILDDLAYVSKSQALDQLAGRAHQRPLRTAFDLITANPPFVTLAAESAGAA
jgi:hypothetical protein